MEVDVDIKNVQAQVKVLKESLKRVNNLYKELGNNFQDMQSWNDAKSQEAKAIVASCGKDIQKMGKSINQAIVSLEKILKPLIEYEKIQLWANSSERSYTSFAESLQSKDFVKKKSESERLSDFKQGITTIDHIIENYAESLENRGLSPGPVMNAVLDNQRNMLQAGLLRTLNGDFSKPVATLTAEDFDLIIDNCRSRGLLYYSHSSTTPRSLSATKYGFTSHSINGIEMRVYNDPVETNSLLIRQQGNSQYDMEGTCGLCQCSNMLTLAGVMESTEDSIISAAMHSSDDVLECMELFNEASEERGGTTVRNRQEILSRCGLQTYCLPVNFDRKKTTSQLSEAIRTGHGVIVSVDVAYLWRNGQSGGHAISLISVTEDGNTFIYNDTGTGTMGTISAQDLACALTGRPANVTSNIIR